MHASAPGPSSESCPVAAAAWPGSESSILEVGEAGKTQHEFPATRLSSQSQHPGEKKIVLTCKWGTGFDRKVIWWPPDRDCQALFLG